MVTASDGQTPMRHLALTNAACAVVSQGPPPGGVPGRGFGQGPTEEEKEKARVRIGLTKEQQADIDKVFRDSDVLMREIRTRFGELSKQLYGLYDSYDFDRAQAQSIRKELLKLHRRMGDIHADNEEKLRRIMTREQFDRMRKLMNEARDQMRKAWEEQRKRRGEGAPAGRPY